MAGTRSASGLVCSHGSDLDFHIPRPKMPKTALPPELRRKLKLAPREDSRREESYGVGIDEQQRRGSSDGTGIYTAGSGVLKAVGSGRDGSFLKRGSGVPMSQRASRMGQYNADQLRQRALVQKPTLQASPNKAVLEGRSARVTR